MWHFLCYYENNKKNLSEKIIHMYMEMQTAATFKLTQLDWTITAEWQL